MTQLSGEKILMRIFLGESDQVGHRPLYKVLVEFFRTEGFAGATVLRGMAGFGAHSIFHSDQLLRLSLDLPIIIEVVESQEKIDAAMPRINAMMNGGMITQEKVTVVRYSHKK